MAERLNGIEIGGSGGRIEPEHDADLEARDLSHLFPWEVTKIAYTREKYVRRFQQHFMDLFQQEADRLRRR